MSKPESGLTQRVRISRHVICRDDIAAVKEIYLSVVPLEAASAEQQAKDIFTAIREELRSAEVSGKGGAAIFAEHIFTSLQDAGQINSIRADIYGDLADEIAPTVLISPDTGGGPIHGVQVHALVCDESIQPVLWNDKPVGRQVTINDSTWVRLSNIGDSTVGDEGAQAKYMFETSEQILRQFGGDFLDVARTWLWLGDINTWYDRLNQVRTEFFKSSGLIDPAGERIRMPASTGIGIFPDGGRACSMDLIAVIGEKSRFEYVEAGGDQDSAFDYGSAFSRALVAHMPAGPTLFISGTAAIDERGNTEHVGQIDQQIQGTLEHIQALLDEQNCRREDVLSALVYCKDEQVLRQWRDHWAKTIDWPRVTLVGEVCRPDLLFEAEVTACPTNR